MVTEVPGQLLTSAGVEVDSRVLPTASTRAVVVCFTAGSVTGSFEMSAFSTTPGVAPAVTSFWGASVGCG